MAAPPPGAAAHAPQPLLPLLLLGAIALISLFGWPHHDGLAAQRREGGGGDDGPADGRLHVHVPVFMTQAGTEARHAVRSVLNRARDAYRLELVVRMKALDRMVQERLPTWKAHTSMPGLTARLQERVWEGMARRLPECWEANERVLDRLLRLPEVTVGLPMSADSEPKKEEEGHQDQHASDRSGASSSSSNSTSSENHAGYNDGVQVLTHLLRDWAEEGRELRRRTYEPIYRAVARLFPEKGARILVPGAGLGRLAFELAYGHRQQRHRVVALDISPVMAAATASVLRLLLRAPPQEAAALEVYPFLHDPLINQHSHAARFHPVMCPDAAAVKQARRAAAGPASWSSSLSLEIGDLVALADAQPGSQDAVVTCFLIDTGKHVLDYLWAIRRLLRPGGAWLNLGPLNYHVTLLDGAVQLTFEEVEAAAAEMGFVKQPGFVDLVPEPSAYRPDPFLSSSAHPAFLRSDVYHPAFGVYKKEEG